MTNAELIAALRCCADDSTGCGECPFVGKCMRAYYADLKLAAADAIRTLCDELATYHAKSVTDDKRIEEMESQLPKECEFKSYADKIPNARNRYCTQCGAYLSDEEFENHTVRYCYFCGSKVKGRKTYGSV